MHNSPSDAYRKTKPQSKVFTISVRGCSQNSAACAQQFHLPCLILKSFQQWLQYSITNICYDGAGTVNLFQLMPYVLPAAVRNGSSILKTCEVLLNIAEINAQFVLPQVH